MAYQPGAAMMDALVLAIIYKEDAYGYKISQEIKKVVSLKDSTLYPVLKRLQEAGYLETYDRPFQGRNRKYYHITGPGIAKYEACVKEWLEYKENVEQILMSEEQEGEQI